MAGTNLPRQLLTERINRVDRRGLLHRGQQRPEIHGLDTSSRHAPNGLTSTLPPGTRHSRDDGTPRAADRTSIGANNAPVTAHLLERLIGAHACRASCKLKIKSVAPTSACPGWSAR